MRKENGFTFLELLLSVFTGTLLLAGSYYAYGVLARQFASARSEADMRAAGYAALDFISAELRKAGRVAYDDAMASSGGAIDAPVVATDSAGANFCCDALRVEYDESPGIRRRTTIYADARDNVETRYALYMDVDERAASGEWAPLYAHAYLVDDVERFDVVVGATGESGMPTSVALELTLRAKEPGLLAENFSYPSYSAAAHLGAHTDRYARKWFRRETLLRNAERYSP